ncbi:hypothetical protein KUCAC02_025143 [Chaenocephalus aceratus]|nr:hypothetical protein KUCAC02_025143 [Chaenocephalus aceratus]
MYTTTISHQDGQESLVVEERNVSVYVEQPAMRTVHGCYPIGLCDCPSGNFQGIRSETSIATGTEALISVGILAIPVKAHRWASTSR